MYIYLFDREDRLGSNIVNYISQINLAYKNNLIIRFNKNENDYRYYNSPFVKELFKFINIQNEKLKNKNIDNNIEFILKDNIQQIKVKDSKNICVKCGKMFKKYHYFLSHLNCCNEYRTLGKDLFRISSYTLKNIKQDLISYFNENIEQFINIKENEYFQKYKIPFNIDKTILVHLRLDDRTSILDYDGKKGCEYYRKKIENNEDCFDEPKINENYQAPLSKYKIDNIINLAKKEFNNHKIILLTSPNSDTSEYEYDVIKNKDENIDLYLLTMCKVVILSRSNFAVSSLFFSNKKKVYCPLWSHFTSYGLDTKYDKNSFFYFY